MRTHVQRTDPSTSTKGHSSDAGSRAGPLMSWLRQQYVLYVSRHTSLSHTPTAVSTECSCKAHLSAEVFWSHHWYTGLSPLAADTRAHRVQDRSADLQSWMVWHHDIWDHLSVSLTCLADGLCALQSPTGWQYQLLNCLRSAAERFLFPVLKRGTNYRNKSPLRHLCLPSNVTKRRFYLGNHFRTLLLIDTLVDLVVP